MPTGKTTAYDLTNGVIINMDEAIYMYSPDDLPFQNGVDGNGLSIIGSMAVDQKAFSWLDEENLAPRSTIAAALTTGETVLTVASGDQTKFSTGDVVTIRKAGAGEVLRITGYGSTADTLTVARAWGGTAVNYATSATVIGVGTALEEGSDPERARTKDTTTRTNYTQIFGPTAVHMSATNRLIPRYGITDQWAHQLMLRTGELLQTVEHAGLYGIAVDSTSGKIRTTGGLAHFVTTVLDSSSTQLTALKVQTNLQTNYNYGGVPDRLAANPASLIDLNDIANTGIIRQTVDDPMRGRVRTEWIETEFGSLAVVRNRWVAPIDAFAFKRDNVKIRKLRPVQFEMLGKTGDADKGQVVGELGFEVKGEKHMHRYNSLTY